MNITASIEEPTDWVNSMVVVEKPNSSLRICIDPRNLNKAIKRRHYTIPTTEEILSKMGGSKRFTKLDASNAYWQIPIDESSSKLPKFNSLTGRYRFLHIPYSIHSVRNVCQQRIAQIIENIEGAENSEDDIIIWGENSDDENIHRHEMDILKNLVTMPLVLKFFDSKLPTKISCDSSLDGLTAVLEQKHNDTWYLVGCASRSFCRKELLSARERNFIYCFCLS